MRLPPRGGKPSNRGYSTTTSSVLKNRASVTPFLAKNGLINESQHSTYSYNEPWRGTADGCTVNWASPWVFADFVAEYHTHGNDPPGSNRGERFSDDDDLDDRLRDFLGTPDSWIKEYVPGLGYDPEWGYEGEIIGATPRPMK